MLLWSKVTRALDVYISGELMQTYATVPVPATCDKSTGHHACHPA